MYLLSTLKILTQLMVLTALAAVLVTESSAQSARIDRIVSFGTSLSDTGNSFIWLSDLENRACGTLHNVPPYEALDELKIPDGAYAKGGHHFTNGATWLEGLARFWHLPVMRALPFRIPGLKRVIMQLAAPGQSLIFHVVSICRHNGMLTSLIFW